MIPGFLKRNSILLITLLIYLALVFGIAFGIDLVFYQREKRTLYTAKNTPEDLFPDALGDIMAALDVWQNQPEGGATYDTQFAKIKEMASATVQGPTSIYRIKIVRSDGEVIYDEEANKFHLFNDASNTLWLRRFIHYGVRKLLPHDPTGGRDQVWFYFTTPDFESLKEEIAGLQPSVLEVQRLKRLQDDLKKLQSNPAADAGKVRELQAQIDQLKDAPDRAERLKALSSRYEKIKTIPEQVRDLTLFYRWLTIYIVAGLTILTVLYLKFILMPMRNVTSSIESSNSDRTEFIRRPSSRLERLYNEMARGTVLARLQERLGVKISRGTPLTGWELVAWACGFLVEQRAVSLVACVELSDDGPGRRRWTGRSVVRRARRAFAKMKDEEIAGALAGQLATAPAASGSHWMNSDARLGRSVAARIATDPERPGVYYAVGLSIRQSARAAEQKATEEFLARFASIIEEGLADLLARNRTLVRERDRASINLSRNLGHDLTNIIATSKLELMTLEQLLHNGPVIEGERRAILNESLQGLLNSTKFLQEVVNLYRAYAFLKEPILETHDPNQLISDTVRLFRLSTSERVKIVEHLDPNAPKFRVDPRLLKLALFNLFSNAVEATRRDPNRENTQSVITVSAAGSAANGSELPGLAITVQDNGTGILNESGQLANPEEIDRVFALGYTLSETHKGEGLGLNWVRTIVQDIHGGAISAENAVEGGARFILRFPAMQFDAKVG